MKTNKWLLVAISVMLVGIVVFGSLASCQPQPKEFKFTVNLLSMKNVRVQHGDIAGGFLLMSGRIGVDEFLYAWAKKPDTNEIFRIVIPVKCARILMDDDENPRLEGSYFFYHELHPSELRESWTQAILHVPHNTIVSIYNLEN
jgi:hypothetical protein